MAAPLFVSSGNPTLDQRYRWALDYLGRGDPGAAADILEQVVEAAPGFATAWFALAVIREQAGNRDGAVAAFARSRDADPQDYHGARLHLARLGAGETTPEMTATYVRRLFDQHAPEFDRSLLERLAYRGPELLLDAVRAVAGPAPHFTSALDLGCGTGLSGAPFRPLCDRLLGVDLSPGMIEQARAKNMYDALVAADVNEHLAAESAGAHDLVLAADVFVYCSDLAPIIGAIARVLMPGGLFAFTVETFEGDGARLRETLRYAHSASHVRASVAAAGLALRHFESATIRTEKNAPVAGLVVIASAPTH